MVIRRPVSLLRTLLGFGSEVESISEEAGHTILVVMANDLGGYIFQFLVSVIHSVGFSCELKPARVIVTIAKRNDFLKATSLSHVLHTIGL